MIRRRLSLSFTHSRLTYTLTTVIFDRSFVDPTLTLHARTKSDLLWSGMHCVRFSAPHLLFHVIFWVKWVWLRECRQYTLFVVSYTIRIRRASCMSRVMHIAHIAHVDVMSCLIIIIMRYNIICDMRSSMEYTYMYVRIYARAIDQQIKVHVHAECRRFHRNYNL